MYPFRNNFLRTPHDPYDPEENMMRGNYGKYDIIPPPYGGAGPQQFGAQQQLEQQQAMEPNNMGGTPQQNDFMSAYREMMQRQNGPAMAAYSKFVNDGAPREEDYKPTKMGKLAAILSGVGASYQNPIAGMEIGEHILRGRYKRALEKHTRQGGYLKEAANLETAGTGKQLAVMNSIREAENQRKDNERADKQFALSVRTANLNMQKTLLEIANFGRRAVTDKATGILYMVDELNGTKIPLGKFDQSTGERIDEGARSAQANAQAVDPILRSRQHDLQQNAQAFQFDQMTRSHEHGKEMKKKDEESIGQTNIRNATNIHALIRTNPKKYERVFVLDKPSGETRITNPLAEKGIPLNAQGKIDYDRLTSQEIADYNAFVELHNINVKGIDEGKKLTPIPSRFEPIKKPEVKPQSKNNRYGLSPYAMSRKEDEEFSLNTTNVYRQ